MVKEGSEGMEGEIKRREAKEINMERRRYED